MRGGGSYCDVRDVARAHAQALEHGRSGESYLLGGYNLEVGELARMVSRLSGVPAPIRIPYPLMLAFAGMREVGARLRGQRSPISRQLVRGARRYTFDLEATTPELRALRVEQPSVPGNGVCLVRGATLTQKGCSHASEMSPIAQAVVLAWLLRRGIRRGRAGPADP